MRVVVGHRPDADAVELRQIMLGSGLECSAEDCVRWDHLSVRLGRGDTDLVLLEVAESAEPSWQALQEAGQLTTAPLMVMGPPENADLANRARRSGAVSYLDQAQLRVALDSAVDQWLTRGQIRGKRGKVLSVFAPTPGSGGSTVAVNLAGALNRKHAGEVALVELASEFGDLALLLNVEPRHTAEDLCRRWASLDKTCLKGSFTDHQSGLKVLVNAAERSGNEYLDLNAARRIAILSRMTMGYTVLALDARLSPVELEAMRLSDAVAFVVRPDVPAVKRAQRTWQQLLAAGILRDRIRLVVNRYGQPGQLALRQVEAALGVRAAQLIPEDPRSVNRAANLGRLLHEQSRLRKISRRFASLARDLNGKTPRGA
jgi:pilus assembly protein CpaE